MVGLKDKSAELYTTAEITMMTMTATAGERVR